MTDTLTNPRHLDAVATRDRELFGRVFLLPGLALAHRNGEELAENHPMSITWDLRGRLVYQCAPECQAHAVLAAMADRSVWFAYCVQAHILPHEITDVYQRRALIVEHLSSVWLAAEPSYDPVTALGWLTYPTVSAT
ncbi:MAG: hypothetical protein ACRD0P_21275 [Stackebrandtia sp.]